MHILKPTLRFSTRLLSTFAVVFAIFLSGVRLIPVLASSRTEPIQHFECGDRLNQPCYITWHPDNYQLAIRGNYDSVHIRRIVDKKPLGEFYYEGRNIIVWTPDGGALTTVSINWIFVKAPEDGEIIQQVDPYNWLHEQYRAGLIASNDLSDIETMAWNADGSRLVFASGDYLAIWNIESNTFELVNTPEDRSWDRDAPIAVDWSSDGSTIALATVGQLSIIDAATYDVLMRVSFPPHFVTEELYSRNILTWSPNSDRVAVAVHTSRWYQYEEPARILLFDTDTGEFERMLETEAKFVRSVAWSPDGRWLATASVSPSNNQTGDTIYYENAVRIWDVENNELAELIPFNSIVYMVDWSADGDYLATSTFSGDIDIWAMHLD